MLLNYALKYLKLGLSIIPLRPRSKEPLIAWTEFQKRRPAEEEIRSWFQRWPNANLGIVTGTISGVVVIDLDGPEGIAQAQKLTLTSAVVSITGNGKHLWYRAPKDIVQNAVKSLPGLDVRGEGGYVVVPPSIHESGRRYHFLNSCFQINSLPEFPKQSINVEQKSVNNLPKQEGWIARALEDLKDGNIDNTLVRILGRLRSDGYSAVDARAFLLPHVARVGAEDGHLEAKIENIWNRYEAKPNREMGNAQFGATPDFGSSLVIHSPTNPDSLKQFERCRQMVSSDESQNLRTGYDKLDQMLQGGLKSSRLLTIAARTGTGKTNFLIGIARTLCEANKRVLLFSTETPYSEIWARYIATLTDPTDFERHKLFICDSFAPNIEKVEEAINEIKPDVFMFDHINHVSEEQRELGAFMQGLNYLRRKYDTAGIVTAQLNRSADWIDLKTGEKVTPRMSMIKGSGTIEQASSRVLLLSETRVLPEYTEIIGNLDKNDNGPKGLIHFGLMNKPYKMVEL